MRLKGPKLSEAIKLARTICEQEFKADKQISVSKDETVRDINHSFQLKIETEDGEREIRIVAKKDVWFHSGRSEFKDPEADRVLVEAGSCVSLSRGSMSKRKTRNVPVRDNGTINEKTLRKAIRESVELVKEDMRLRVEFKKRETAARDAQTAVRDAIEQAYPSTFECYNLRTLETAGIVKIPGLAKEQMYVTVKVLPAGHVTIGLSYLSEDSALEVLRRLTELDASKKK